MGFCTAIVVVIIMIATAGMIIQQILSVLMLWVLKKMVVKLILVTTWESHMKSFPQKIANHAIIMPSTTILIQSSMPANKGWSLLQVIITPFVCIVMQRCAPLVGLFFGCSMYTILMNMEIHGVFKDELQSK